MIFLQTVKLCLIYSARAILEDSRIAVWRQNESAPQVF